MDGRNPYAITFGRIPNRFIGRDMLIDDIVETLESETVDGQAFKITGIRGTGKTVTLTAIERTLKQNKKWVIIDLRPGGNLIDDLVSALYAEVPFLKEYIDTNLNLSALGIGVEISRRKPSMTSDTALKKLLKEVSKKKKRVLVVIDEVHYTPALVDFIQQFQIFIREELPIYLIVAGLYEDIECIENTDGLTFFLRAEKYEMTPINITIIREEYRQTLGIDFDTADEMARMTRGYAFAYQAFGKYMWESGGKVLTDMVVAQVDDALAQKVYNKIWSELRPTDKWFLQFIAKKDSMSATELLEMTHKSHSEWSAPRKRLIEKGIIDGSIRGRISLRLPRFKEYVEANME